MNEFVTEWSLGKSHENCKCFVEKFLPQSTLLSLVPRRRFGYVLLRLEANTGDCVYRQLPAILVDLIGVETTVEFGPLLRRQSKRVLVRSDAVPQVFNKFYALIERKHL